MNPTTAQMAFDPTLITAIASVIGAILCGIGAFIGYLLKRVLAKVNHIELDTAVMKTQVAGALRVEDEHTKTRERVIVLETKADAAHRRLDEFERRSNHG